MEVMRLEEFRPELGFGQFGGHIFAVFALHCRIGFEYRVDNVDGQVVFETVAAIGLRLDVSEKGTGYADLLFGGFLAARLGVGFSVRVPELFAGDDLRDDEVFVQLQQVGLLDEDSVWEEKGGEK